MAAIKIRDLSVGDWVSVSSNGFSRITAVYLTPMGEMVELLKGEKYSRNFTEFIEPIPLTPEILEKNGFEENCGRWYNSEALMEFEQYKDGWCRTINCGEYSVYFIKYVHQLQRALRLAGVGKEIEL